MHSCQRFVQLSKHLLNSISGIAFKAFFDSAYISSIVSKRYPRSGLLSLGNSQESHGAKSGEYGGCGTICVEFLAKWSRRTSAVLDGALSWCKNHELSARNIFWNGVEWSSWNANSVSKVSNCHSTIFVHYFFDLIAVLLVSWCWWSSGAFQVINTFSAFFEVFVPLINIFLQHSERFHNWNFILQTKFNGTSLLNKFRHCKTEKITCSRLENTSVTM